MNETIREYAKSKKVKLWQVAERYGVWDTNFSKMLRHPLTTEEENRLLEIIDTIANEQGTDSVALNRLEEQGNSTHGRKQHE